MERILIIGDESSMVGLVDETLNRDGYSLLYVADGRQGLDLLAREQMDLVITDFDLPGLGGVEFLRQLRRGHPNQRCIMLTPSGAPEAVIGALREHICDILPKPFTPDDLLDAVGSTLAKCPIARIEVVSAKPEWVELLVPCDLNAVAPLQKALAELETDIPQEAREALDLTFRELLNNAIEHGGKLDPTKYVEVSFTKLERAVVYMIKDPGEGFNPSQLAHAAQSGESGDPLEHFAERDAQGLRAGGFGLLLAKNLVDEVIYNERGNKLMFVKYLEPESAAPQTSDK
jgi:DNA-binding response OmpR family regulator